MSKQFEVEGASCFLWSCGCPLLLGRVRLLSHPDNDPHHLQEERCYLITMVRSRLFTYQHLMHMREIQLQTPDKAALKRSFHSKPFAKMGPGTVPRTKDLE